MEEFKYLGTTLTNQNCIQEEITKEQIEVRECLLSFGVEFFVLQFSIQKYADRINRIIILSAAECGYETWSLTLRERPRLKVFENRVLRITFGPKRDKGTGA